MRYDGSLVAWSSALVLGHQKGSSADVPITLPRDEEPSGPLSLRERAGVRVGPQAPEPSPYPLPGGEGTRARRLPLRRNTNGAWRDEEPSGPLSLRERAGVRAGPQA